MTESTTAESITGQALSAEIITTGTEILLGDIVDTNAVWIAQQLRDAGVNLYYKSTVGDNEARVRWIIELAISRSNIIIVTGGLGPTADDITRQAIANATDSPLHLHEGALETLKTRFARFGTTMTENNIQQAYIPENAILIENPVGTAPGFIVEKGKSSVIALPGVPREMKHLMAETVLPYVRQRSGNTGVIVRRILRTIGIGESTLDSRIRDLMERANPTVGLAAHTAQADMRIAARAGSEDAANLLLDEIEAEIRNRVGPHIYSTTAGESIETTVASQLQAANATVALLETNTQGNLAARLADALDDYNPVASHWRVGEDELPASLQANLDTGGSSEAYTEVIAERCAQGLFAETGANYALVVLGTDGADEGIYGNARGQTCFALVDGQKSETLLARYGGQDQYTRTRIGNQALQLLWNRLKQ